MPTRSALTLTWCLILALVGLIATADLGLYEGQRAGVAATISQALLIASTSTHGVGAVVVGLLLGALGGHLFIPRADGEPLTWRQVLQCAGLGAMAMIGALAGTVWLYQRQ